VRPLHVGLNLVYWQPDSGGAGTYARELIRAVHTVEPEVRVTAWVGAGAPAGLEELAAPAAVDWVRLPLKSSGSPVHVVYELAALGLDARRRGVDVVHGLAYATPAVAPGVATVVTILDVTWIHSPETVTWLARTMFGLLTRIGTRRADRVVAISEAAKADLVQTLGLAAGRIDVTPLGVGSPAPERSSPPELRRRLGVPPGAPVVLAVGQLTRNKNLEALVRALVLLPSATRLVICGRETAYRAELERLAVRLGVRERIAFTGFVGDADLEALYATATCLALPSLYEGFGLSALEAMARGLPVACSDTAVLREVVGDAAVLFDARDDASVGSALRRVLSERPLRSSLRERGLARARLFTWERTAEATLESYRRALAGRRPRRP
jgi:glycosyltransferase involved in cell wall biosynthesis